MFVLSCVFVIYCGNHSTFSLFGILSSVWDDVRLLFPVFDKNTIYGDDYVTGVVIGCNRS
jgi:hypothetical protein